MPERQAMKKVSKTKRGSDGKRQERVAGIMKDKRGYMDLRGRKRWRERAREVEAEETDTVAPSIRFVLRSVTVNSFATITIECSVNSDILFSFFRD